MALVPTVAVTLAGSTLTLAAASGGGDKFVPDENTRLLINNASGSSITATIVTPYAPAGLALADLVLTVPAGALFASGAFSQLYFANAGGQADITWSATTSVTFLPIR
jgi:hypothetical protein